MRIRGRGGRERRLDSENALVTMLSHGCDKVQLKPGAQKEHCVHVSHKQPGGRATSESSLFCGSGSCLLSALGGVRTGSYAGSFSGGHNFIL